LSVPGVAEKVRLPAVGATAPVLARLRRQFITFSKTQSSASSNVDEGRIKTLFVQYLNSNFADDE
jgi:tRNA uridine 5-carbamoylmethylation protein Kti12